MANLEQPEGQPPGRVSDQLGTRSKTVRSAARLATRSFRQEHRMFLAEGPQAVREATRTPGATVDVFATAEGMERCAGFLDDLVKTYVVSDEVLGSIADTVAPQGIVARCRFLDRPLDSVLKLAPRLIVICADVRDPGNAGTVIRCADAVGADAVIFAGDSVDPFNPKAVRASVGSVFHVPLVIERDTAAVTVELQAAGLTVIATDTSGSTDLFDSDDVLAGPSAWLMGNEAWGLPDTVRDLADVVISVPIYGAAESLNLATAAAVCLYASARVQRTR